MLCLICSVTHAGDPWSHLGSNAARSAVVDADPVAIDQSAWVLDTQFAGQSVTFVGQSGVVTWDNYIYAQGEIAGCAHLICASRADGSIVWIAPVLAPVLDSWSTPVIDETNRTVVVTTGNQCLAFHAKFGYPRWTAILDLNIVNASPLVTDDMGTADRMFITDYDGIFLFGGGHLYCINVDQFDPVTNPYQPGEIVWTVNMGAATSGNSPAYDSGAIYVADLGSQNNNWTGRISAFDAAAISPPAPLWQTSNPVALGFFGGVTITNGYVYAGSYAFTGAQQSANLLKLDALTGAVEWSTPCNRTSTIPVVLDDGRIAVSAGLLGFGSLPSIQLFSDLGTSAVLNWDSAIDSWVDTNTNGQFDPGEFISTGGWTTQAILFNAPTANVLMVGGSENPGLFGAPETLFVLDLDAPPSSPGFILETYTGAGSSPAYDTGNLFTIGQNGLVCFGPVTPPPLSDMDRDLLTTPEDLYLWGEGVGPRDVNQNQMIDNGDFFTIESDSRASEVADTAGTGGGAL